VLIRWADTIGPETVQALNDWVVQLARSPGRSPNAQAITMPWPLFSAWTFQLRDFIKPGRFFARGGRVAPNLHHTVGVDFPFAWTVRALIGNSDDCKQMANRDGPRDDASSTGSSARDRPSGMDLPIVGLIAVGLGGF
jgi:hypothetical protein